MKGAFTEEERERLITRLCDHHAEVVFFPVRHHSPACALLIRDWIRQHRPAAVLIEGPSDYNPRLDELRLDHRLPIAIYSYFRTDSLHSGVYYPFCEYSPEWQALQTGFEVDAEVRFIDLPWAESYADDRASHRYADAELRRGRYVAALCERLQVEDFDDLWDRMVESQTGLPLEAYLRRAHEFCLSTRCWEEQISASDLRREAFMAEQALQTTKRVSGKTLVVTGGFHSSAILARLEKIPAAAIGVDDPQSRKNDSCGAVLDRGVALTTYSFERLDGLTGYNAGMPSPGFYQHAWRQRVAHEQKRQVDGEIAFDHRPLLGDLVDSMRRRKQTLSTADLIAVETSAHALAAIRGRRHVWRRDLIDAVMTSLIKDELEYGCDSPMLDAVHEVLRGSQSGKLADGVRLPPLVAAIREELEAQQFKLARHATTLELDLLAAADVSRSQLLHRLSTLGIRGFRLIDGTDFIHRDDMQQLWESWEIRWSPDFESSCIEAARYGAILSHAVAAKLTEQAGGVSKDAMLASRLLVQASRCGVDSLSDDLIEELDSLISTEPRFTYVGEALGHLLFLYCFDEAFGTVRLPQLRGLISDAFARSLWLLESLGKTTSSDRSLIAALHHVAETERRVGDILETSEEEYRAVLSRVQADTGKSPQVRGAAAGMLWSVGGATADSVLADMMFFSSPERLGDFLAGLFALAREVAQRHPALVQAIDGLLLQFDGEAFQTALPSLRMAFTSFAPREKHHLLLTLFESVGMAPARAEALQAADEATAAEALAIEDRIFETIAKYQLEPIDGGI